jgi:hypothetical protein
MADGSAAVSGDLAALRRLLRADAFIGRETTEAITP